MLHVTVSKRTLFLLVLAWVLVIPATAGATHLFADVSHTNVHAEGIEWVKDAGVTVGCQDGTVFCPDDPVTRAQMATFMYRLSGNDPATAPSVNADLVDGFHALQLITAVVFDQTADAPDQNGDLVSAVIGVPADGFLIMSGGVDAAGSTFDEYGCRLTVDSTEVAGTSRLSFVHFAGGVHTFNSEENCETTGVQPVTTGSYTVALNITGRDTVNFFDASVWALYVPLDGTPIPMLP